MNAITRYLILFGMGLCCASGVGAGSPPNIIFIMADDHTTQAIGAYGSRLAKLNPTPNLDALASGGMLFDRVFCTNSICTPSRACIMTGQYSQTNGVLDLEGSLSADHQYLPIEMKRAGYQTAMIGKWHLKKEPSAFDYYCVLPGQGTYFDPKFRVRGPMPWMRNTIQETGHSTDCITKLTLDWLEKYLKRYLRCVKGVDDNLKRLFDYLKEEGLWENTVILYTGDQGFMLGEHDYIDKRWMYDESMRMPFIVHYPKMVKRGSRNPWLINNTDFAPTMLELAGVQTPDYMQGHSFASALKGAPKPNNWRKATYYRYWMHMAHLLTVPAHFGIRTERYKLIFFYGKDYVQRGGRNTRMVELTRTATPAAWELYDLQKDPREMHNRYNDPEYKTVVAELRALLKMQRTELKEEDQDYPILQRIIDAHWN